MGKQKGGFGFFLSLSLSRALSLSLPPFDSSGVAPLVTCRRISAESTLLLDFRRLRDSARRCAPQAKEGAPIFFRACARRAASAGVCRGSALAAGRTPGGPPEAMVRAKKWCQQVPTLRRRISQPFYQNVESRKIILQRGDRRIQYFFGGGCIPPRRDRNKPKGGCLGVYWTPSVA